MKIGIYYGSSTGVTERIANSIAKIIQGSDIELKSIKNLMSADINDKDLIILGSSTWGYGDLQEDWVDGIEILKAADLTGKRLAIFGVGDQVDWPDTFVDAMGILYAELADSAAQFIGTWPVTGYGFSSSKAVINGMFVGLALDEANQSDETESRIIQWSNQLLSI